MKKACFSTKKSANYFNINRLSVLASRMAGKGRRGLLKICSMLGLSSQITRPAVNEHTVFWEEKALELREENMKMAADRAKDLVKKEYGTSSSEVVDVPTSFDGRGVVSAVAEVSSQILDVSLKCRLCNQRDAMEEKKRNGTVSSIEYLDLFVEHEPKCMKNHFASPQVYNSFRNKDSIN